MLNRKFSFWIKVIKTSSEQRFQIDYLSTNDKSTNDHKINKVLKSLKSKDVHYIKADKINAIVILGKPDYFDRVSEMLNSTLCWNIYHAQIAL